MKYKISVVVFFMMTLSISAESQTAAEREQMEALAAEYDSAWSLYQALREEAGGGQAPPDYNELPDWSGLWTYVFEPYARGMLTSNDRARAKLTPEAQSVYERLREIASAGHVYDDNLSECGPAAYPRWLMTPFLKEFAVLPHQTWMLNEMMNETRRIYTDGRDHPTPEQRYPLYNGDSVGFWDGDQLIIHTNQVMSRPMGRADPNQSEQMEGVEIWRKSDDDNMEVHVWLYDPLLLAEPWYTKRLFRKIQNDDQSLRVRYWNCAENQNNDVYKTEQGGTQFTDFTFD